MKHCGARLQKPGGQRKRGSVKHVLEALSCLNSGSARSNARQMRSMAHTIQTGQTSLHECCPTGLLAHTKVVLFYDLTSMGSGELGDAFISANKFFNEVKASHGFFGDVYHIGAYGERWVSWPAWVLDRNVHTRGIESHANATDGSGSPGGVDALDELAEWVTADGGGVVTGTVNGAVTFNGSGDPNLTTVYYGNNQTSPTMPPVFGNTEELLVIGFEDEAHCTPSKWADVTGAAAGADGPAGNYVLGGYYDSVTPNLSGLATDGSYTPGWDVVAASHTAEVKIGAQLGGALAMTNNATNVAFKTDHSGDTDNHTYDVTFWSNPNYCLGYSTTTNTCSGVTDSGQVFAGQHSDMFAWMGTNHPASNLSTYKYTDTTAPCGTTVGPAGQCCCGINNMGCYRYVSYVTLKQAAVTIQSFYKVTDTINYINTNYPGTGVAAGDDIHTLENKINAIYGTALGQDKIHFTSNGATCMCGSTGPACNNGCILDQPDAAGDLHYTFNWDGSTLKGSMRKYRQSATLPGTPDQGTPTVVFQHDYCVAKKVINAHLGNIRYFLYSVPPVAASRVTSQLQFPLHVVGAMENGPLPVAPVGSACTLTAATTSGPYDGSGFNNMKAWGAGFGYNIIDLPCSSAQFSIDIQAYLNL